MAPQLFLGNAGMPLPPALASLAPAIAPAPYGCAADLVVVPDGGGGGISGSTQPSAFLFLDIVASDALRRATGFQKPPNAAVAVVAVVAFPHACDARAQLEADAAGFVLWSAMTSADALDVIAFYRTVKPRLKKPEDVLFGSANVEIINALARNAERSPHALLAQAKTLQNAANVAVAGQGPYPADARLAGFFSQVV